MAEKKTYAVADDVNWVNGAPVPKDRKVELTAEEAAFDLAYARISLATEKPGTEKQAAPAKAGD